MSALTIFVLLFAVLGLKAAAIVVNDSFATAVALAVAVTVVTCLAVLTLWGYWRGLL